MSSECYTWGQYEAYLGLPRIPPDEWCYSDQQAWLKGYDSYVAQAA